MGGSPGDAGGGGGFEGTPGVVSSPWSARNALVQAQMALARHELHDAQRRADELLDARIPRDVRASALLVAADAAYAMGSYGSALARYGELLSLQDTGPAAVHAALQTGWAQLRQGRRDDARLSWVQAADRFPADSRAPVALLLAAEVAIQTGDTTTAKALLGRVVAQFSSNVYAGAAKLGRSVLALREHREDAAARDLEEVVRSHGTPAIHARRGIMDAFALETRAALNAPVQVPGASAAAVPTDDPLGRFATAFLQAGDRDTTPYVLHGLSVVAAADRGWSDVVVATLVNRLVDGWSSYPAAPMLLDRVASSAASGGQWPIARQAYEALIARYPGTAMASKARVHLAEGLVHAGAATEARPHLQHAIAVGGDTAARALLLLAEVEEALGHRDAALTAYDRALREHPRAERSVSSLLSHARLLESAGQGDTARSLLQRIVQAADGEAAAEASYRMARILSAQGQDAAAVEWYMTAAYVAEGSRWERPSLLGAARAFTTLNRTDEALIAYRKAMAKPATAAPRDAMPPPAASPPLADERAARDGTGDASLRLAEALRRTGDHEAALDMYLTAAHQTRGGPAASLALLGAIRSLVAIGDRPAAEAIYRRLLESGETDPALLADARKTIRGAAH